MEIIRNTTDFHIKEKTAVAIGKFDGIHRGHKLLLQEMRACREDGYKTAVFTFDPTPSVFFGGNRVKELTTLEEKQDCFQRLGVDYLVEYPFNELTAAVEPEDYVREYLSGKMNAHFIVAGADISFGKKGAGNAALLKRVAAECDCEVRIVEKIQYQGKEISSTRVRQAVLKADMEEAQALLGEPFSVSGEVLHGNALGRTIGFPTINLVVPKQKILPPNGVYFSDVWIDGKIFHGITNIGNKPTVGDGYALGLETFLYDFNRDIYGRAVRVSLLHFVRKEQRFRDFAQLKDAISENVLQGKQYFRIES
ncbi:MAG: bifunctional riboflavin kinase/FAD synthetase [Lachnospiraceae bacterium]|jgi:riboflavin kinase/FMN adenylyltransferase|nr:bifunctional riboflavin kinase/FAD synthetase [Lachnospiraceae bacterium]